MNGHFGKMHFLMVRKKDSSVVPLYRRVRTVNFVYKLILMVARGENVT